jgi:nuclear pore complex protein Nup107
MNVSIGLQITLGFVLQTYFTSQPKLSDPERVLYASLAPSPQTSPVLKTACRSWEDHLWAQISVMCEEKQSTEMLRLGGGFWDGDSAVVEKGVSGGNGENEENEDTEEEQWEKEAVDALESLGSVTVSEGQVVFRSVFRHLAATNIFFSLGLRLTMLSMFPS